MVGKHWAEDDDRALLRAMNGPATPDVALLARRLGRTQIAVRARLGQLRRRTLPKRGGPARDWRDDEVATLRDTIGWRSAEQIAKALGRTPTAVRIKAKRLKLHWIKGSVERSGNIRPVERHRHLGYTARDVAKMLGIACAKTVAWWIEEGWLRGTKRPVRYGNNTVWRIHADAIEAFLRDYRWLYDPARIVDRGWRAFVAGLPPAEWVGTAEAARLLPYTQGSISALCSRGDLAGEHWGSAWRIPMAAIRAFEPPPFGYNGEPTVKSALMAKRQATRAARRTKGWTRKQPVMSMAADQGNEHGGTQTIHQHLQQLWLRRLRGRDRRVPRDRDDRADHLAASRARQPVTPRAYRSRPLTA